MIVAFGIALAVVALGIVFWLLLERRISEKYAVMWLLIGVSVLIVGLFPGMLEWLTTAFGVQVPANLLFTLSIILLLGVTLHLSWELSQTEDEVRRLAEEAALARTQLAELATRLSALEHSTPPADAGPQSEHTA